MKRSRFKVAIVDDEKDARGMVQLMLKEYFPELDVVCDTGNFREALLEISRHKPHLLFLDVEMPGGNGFELLEKLPFKPTTVFITAHDGYAIRAIRASAEDYILKPLNRNEFREVVERLLCGLAMNEEAEHSTSGVRKIAIPSLSGLSFVGVDDILYAEADSNYTVLHWEDKKEVVCRTLGQFEEDLNSFGFLRVHHKYLINLNHVKTYHKGKGGGSVVLSNQCSIPVSVRKKPELFRAFALQG